VAARDDEGEGRVLDGRVVEDDRVDVPLDVVDADERLAERVSHRLGVGQPDEQRADEARPLRHGHAVNLLPADARALERLRDHQADLVEVLARGDLGHDPAVLLVQVNLRRDDRREHLPPVAHDGRGRLVARAFDSENQHRLRPFTLPNAPTR
jgi:hypothetical protein